MKGSLFDQRVHSFAVVFSCFQHPTATIKKKRKKHENYYLLTLARRLSTAKSPDQVRNINKIGAV